MRNQRNAIVIVLVGLAGICWADGASAARERGPGLLVVSMRRGKGHDIEALRIGRRGRLRRLTRDGKDKIGLRCLADGRSLLYVSDGKVMELDVTASADRAGAARKLADLPVGLVRAAGNGVGRFLSVSTSGRFLALPHSKGIVLVDRTRGEKRLIEPTCVPPGGGRRKACEAGGASRLVFVHPVFWAFKRRRFFFVAVAPDCPSERAGRHGGPATQSARKRVVVDVLGGLYDVDAGKTLACVRIAGRQPGPVTGLDVSWRDDSAALALSVETAASQRIQRVVDIRQELGKVVLHAARPRKLSVGRFHGWRGRWLTATARRGRLVGLWRWKPGTARRPVRIRALGRAQRVLLYEPSLHSFLLEVPGRRNCDRSRLLVVRRERTSRSLFKWSVWSRLLARDWTGRWGLFKVGSGCRRGKTQAFVARMDGRRILWTSRRHRGLAKRMKPGRAALCTGYK